VNQPLARTMSGQLTARIRERILTGAYAPGTALLQDSIAAEFGVSKIPVREALVQLSAEGLVNVFAHRGFQVRPLSTAEVDEVFRLRLAIEPEAVANGARRAEAADREAAQEALMQLDAAMTADDLGDVGDLNSAFHLALVVPRLQPVAADVLSRLHGLARRYVRIHLLPAGRSRRARREHAGLLEAWMAGRGREAGRLIRAHVEATYRDLHQSLSRRQAP
jgi:DNA-binding GntR family transcriptional regulator